LAVTLGCKQGLCEFIPAIGLAVAEI